MYNMGFTLVIHGGSGDSEYNNKEKYIDFFKNLLHNGFIMLKEGGKALDVVVTIVEKMEDSGLFNAGKGAVSTIDGIYELDASVMDGGSLECGSVSNVSRIKNPVRAAELVMKNTSHVKLECTGAEEFASHMGIPLINPNTYYNNSLETEETIGAVALDTYGNYAVAASTGGIQDKMRGRPSDITDIGAGIYANKSGAVACSGIGEFFQRTVLAYDIMAQIMYANKSMIDSAEESLNKASQLNGNKAIGGIIGIDQMGIPHIVYNTKNMLSGYVYHTGRYEIFL